MKKRYNFGDYKSKIDFGDEKIQSMVKDVLDTLWTAKKDYKPEAYNKFAQQQQGNLKQMRKEFEGLIEPEIKQLQEISSQKVSQSRAKRPVLNMPTVMALQYYQQIIKSRLAYEAKSPDDFLYILHEIIDNGAPWDPEKREDIERYKKRSDLYDGDPMHTQSWDATKPAYSESSLMKWALIDMYPEVKALAGDTLSKSEKFVAGENAAIEQFNAAIENSFELAQRSLKTDKQLENDKKGMLEKQSLDRRLAELINLKTRSMSTFDRAINEIDRDAYFERDMSEEDDPSGAFGLRK